MLTKSKKLLQRYLSIGLLLAVSSAIQADPFLGYPVPLPGKFDLENYDTGGQGVSYYDSTPGNLFGNYRNDDVDIVVGDNSITYVADTQAGEWLRYSVDVDSSVNTITTAVASIGRGGSFHLEFEGPAGGVVTSDSIHIPDTGGWQNWATVTIPLSATLSPGPNMVRVVFDSNGESGYVGSIDYVSLRSSQSGSWNAFVSGNTLPGTIQAEHYDVGGEGVSYHDLDVGNSFGEYREDDVDIAFLRDDNFYVANTKASEWLTYTVANRTGSAYAMQLRVASNGPGGVVHVEINGRDVSGPISIPDTGGWQNWTIVTAPRLTPMGYVDGPHTVRLVLDQNGPTGYVGSIDFIRFIIAGTDQHTDNPYSAPTTEVFAEDYDHGGEGIAYHDTTEGNHFHQARHEDVDLVRPERGRAYLAETKAGEWLEYTLVAPFDMEVSLGLTAGSVGLGGVVHIEVDGVDMSGPLRIPDTGSWQAFTLIRGRPVFLTRGTHVFRLSLDENGPSGYVGTIERVGAFTAAP